VIIVQFTFSCLLSDFHCRKSDAIREPEPSKEVSPAPKRVRAADGVEALTLRTGGAYIPPARLRAMQAKITDKSRYA